MDKRRVDEQVGKTKVLLCVREPGTHIQKLFRKLGIVVETLIEQSFIAVKWALKCLPFAGRVACAVPDHCVYSPALFGNIYRDDIESVSVCSGVCHRLASNKLNHA